MNFTGFDHVKSFGFHWNQSCDQPSSYPGEYFNISINFFTFIFTSEIP